MIHAFITLNVLLRSQLWVSVVLQEAGEKGKEEHACGTMGLLKPGLGLLSGSHWAHSLGHKWIIDLKIQLVFRYRDLSCLPVPRECQAEAKRRCFDLQIAWVLECKRFNGAALYPSNSCLWAGLDKMEEAVQMTRALNWHTVLPSESLAHGTEPRVSWDCCLLSLLQEPSLISVGGLDYLIQTRTKPKHGLVLVQDSSTAEIWYLLHLFPSRDPFPGPEAQCHTAHSCLSSPSLSCAASSLVRIRCRNWQQWTILKFQVVLCSGKG